MKRNSLNFKAYLQNFYHLTRYNFKVIFAHRFIYFLVFSFIVFILITLLRVVNSDSMPKADTIYNLLFLPGILLIFYPCVYGVQLDVDAGMLETLFGIPNYRYKVWLVRLTYTFLFVALLLFVLAVLSDLIIAPIPIGRMVFHLMFPLLFLGCTSFLFATVTHSGHGAGAIMLIIGFGLWFAWDFLAGSRWNLYHNPFSVSSDTSAILIDDTTFYNRVILLVGAIIALLWGLLNLQKREKFI